MRLGDVLRAPGRLIRDAGLAVAPVPSEVLAFLGRVCDALVGAIIYWQRDIPLLEDAAAAAAMGNDAPDADAIKPDELRARAIELRGLLFAAQSARRAALVAALEPLLPTRNLADASEVGFDVPPPTAEAWRDALESMSEPLCADLADLADDVSKLLASLESAVQLEDAHENSLATSVASHEERYEALLRGDAPLRVMAPGRPGAQQLQEDLERDQRAMVKAAVWWRPPEGTALNSPAHLSMMKSTVRRFYRHDLLLDETSLSIRAKLNETKDRLIALWNSDHAKVLMDLRCGRLPDSPETATPENVVDDPWAYDEEELSYMTRHVRDAVEDLKEELNEAAVSVQFRMLSLQSAKLGVNVAAMGTTYKAKEREAEEAEERLIQLQPPDLEDQTQTLWAPVFALEEAAQPLIEEYADALFRARVGRHAAQLSGDYDAAFLSASEEAAKHFHNPASEASIASMRGDEREHANAYPLHSRMLLDAAARNGAMVAAYDTLLNLYREMRFLRRLRQKWSEDWPPQNENLVDAVVRSLTANPHWQLCNHRGRTGVEEAVQRALVWCCGLPEADDAIRRLAGDAGAAAPELSVWAQPNRRDPDSGVTPLPCPIRARFPELPSLEMAALALMQRRQGLRVLRPSRPLARGGKR